MKHTYILWDAVNGIYPETFDTLVDVFVRKSILGIEKDVFEIIEGKNIVDIKSYFTILDGYTMSKDSVTYEKVLETYNRFKHLPH